MDQPRDHEQVCVGLRRQVCTYILPDRCSELLHFLCQLHGLCLCAQPQYSSRGDEARYRLMEMWHTTAVLVGAGLFRVLLCGYVDKNVWLCTCVHLCMYVHGQCVGGLTGYKSVLSHRVRKYMYSLCM